MLLAAAINGRVRMGIEPFEVLSSVGAKATDVRRATEIAQRRREELLAAWRKHHDHE